MVDLAFVVLDCVIVAVGFWSVVQAAQNRLPRGFVLALVIGFTVHAVLGLAEDLRKLAAVAG